MLASEVKKRSEGSSFRRLVEYLLNPKQPEQLVHERVSQVRVSHCASTDAAGAMVEVAMTQQLNTRVTDKTYHLLFSFPQGEVPPAEKLTVIEERLCRALGFDGHQRVSVAHHDTDNFHVHVAINRIHPTRLTGHWPKFSRWALAFESEALERELGLRMTTDWHLKRGERRAAAQALLERLQREGVKLLLGAASWESLHQACERRGLRLERRGAGLRLTHGTGLYLVPSKLDRGLSLAALEKRLGTYEPAAGTPVADRGAASDHTTPAMEAMGGVESEIGRLRREHLDALLAAADWSGLHERLREAGYVIKERGAGFVLQGPGGVQLKPSSVHRKLGRAALEQRLGAFVASAGDQASVGQSRGRQGLGSSSLYAEYQLHVQAVKEAKAAALQRLAADKVSAYAELERLAKERSERAARLGGSPRAQAIHRGHLRARLVRERRMLREELANRRDQVHREHLLPGWLDWLRDQAACGHEEALQVLRRRSERALQAGVQSSPAEEDYDRYRAARDAHWKQVAVVRARAIARLAARGRRLALADRMRRALIYRLTERGAQRERLLERAARVAELERSTLLRARQDLMAGSRDAFPTFREWLAENGARVTRLSPTPLAKVTNVTSEGTVVYRVPGGVVREREGVFEAHVSGPAGLEAFVHLAHARAGAPLALSGSRDFQHAVVAAAARSRLPIRFTSGALEALRQSLMEETVGRRQGSHRQRAGDPAHGRAAQRGGRVRPGGGVGGGRPAGNARGWAARFIGDLHREPDAAPAGVDWRLLPAEDGLCELPARHVARAEGHRPGLLLPPDAPEHVHGGAAPAGAVVRRDRHPAVKPKGRTS